MSKVVSVIIVTYEGSNFLERAIKSVLKQTYQNLEVIVVDDNEPDSLERRKTEELIKKIVDSRIIYLKNKNHFNGAYARNQGINVARGEYIAFLDDDDIYCRERVEECVKCLENAHDYDAVYTNVMIVTDNLITATVKAEKVGDLQKKLILNKTTLGTGSNLFLTRKSVQVIKSFDESFIRYQDVEFMVRFFENFKIINLNKYLVVKCSNGGKNIPNYNKMREVQKKFDLKFEKQISELSDKEYYTYKLQEASELYCETLKARSKVSDILEVKKELEKEYRVKINKLVLIKCFIKTYLKKILAFKYKIFHIYFQKNNELRNCLKQLQTYEI